MGLRNVDHGLAAVEDRVRGEFVCTSPAITQIIATALPTQPVIPGLAVQLIVIAPTTKRVVPIVGEENVRPDSPFERVITRIAPKRVVPIITGEKIVPE